MKNDTKVNFSDLRFSTTRFILFLLYSSSHSSTIFYTKITRRKTTSVFVCQTRSNTLLLTLLSNFCSACLIIIVFMLYRVCFFFFIVYFTIINLCLYVDTYWFSTQCFRNSFYTSKGFLFCSLHKYRSLNEIYHDRARALLPRKSPVEKLKENEVKRLLDRSVKSSLNC